MISKVFASALETRTVIIFPAICNDETVRYINLFSDQPSIRHKTKDTETPALICRSSHADKALTHRRKWEIGIREGVQTSVSGIVHFDLLCFITGIYVT